MAHALTAHERAMLVLQSLKEDTAEDPVWRRTMPSYQAQEFRRLLGLITASNGQIGPVINVLNSQSEVLQARALWLKSLSLWEADLDEIGSALDMYRSEESRVDVQGNQLISRLEDVLSRGRPRVRSAQSPGFIPSGLIEGLKESLGLEIRDLWIQLRIVETWLDETGQDFDGQDPLIPEMRDSLENAKATVLAVREHLAWLSSTPELVEPTELEMETMRSTLRQG